MTATPPEVNLNALYQAGEAARVLGCSVRTLYRYTDAGYCTAGVRRTNGRKVWKGSELLKAWRIVY